MKKIILSLLFVLLTQWSYAQVLPVYTKPKESKPKVATRTVSKPKQKPKTVENQSSSRKSFEPEMVDVKGGTFFMGYDGHDDEKPVHKVTVGSFKMSKFEITQEVWNAVMGRNPSIFDDCETCPVENVSYDEVQAFIDELNKQTGKKYRLPTEAEWEFAARGGNKSRDYLYAGGSVLSYVGWTSSNSEDRTHPVGELEPNELGLYDMTGNVWERCSDWYGPYEASSKSNPKGPTTGLNRIVRGGSAENFDSFCRVTYRLRNDPGSRNAMIGFRLVLP